MHTDPTRCKFSACGRWTFRADGFCSDECAGIVPMTVARGVGIVTPPPAIHASKRRRVRRNEGYIAANGAWVATVEAPFGEVSRDHRDLDRKVKAHQRAAQRSIDRATKVRTAAKDAHVERIYAEAGRRITAADLAPIGDQNH